jgi:CBS-domain-containing membrane protein
MNPSTERSVANATAGRPKSRRPTVRDYMAPGPHATSPKQSLREARDLMEKHAIRHLPVEADGKLVGILSAREIDIVWSLAHAPPRLINPLVGSQCGAFRSSRRRVPTSAIAIRRAPRRWSERRAPRRASTECVRSSQ